MTRADGGFSLSVSARGSDFVIGGSGTLDVAGMVALRKALDDSCKTEGAVVLLDLAAVTQIASDSVILLAEAGEFCRGLGVPFTVSVGAEVLKVLNDAGYDGELLPLNR